jgi:UDPglucose 6-dehydrogenase
MLRKNLAEGRLHFTTDTAHAVRQSLVVFIAVGTPSREDGSPDLRDVLEVAREIGRDLDGYKVVVTKSTVPVGTGRRIQHMLRESSSRGAFDVASNPEFLRGRSTTSCAPTAWSSAPTARTPSPSSRTSTGRST